MNQVLIKETESLISKLFQKVFGEFADKVSHAASNRILEYEISLYKNTFLTKSFFHRSKPVPLYDFYIPLNIETLSNLGYEKTKTVKTDSCKNLFSKSKYLTIIGTAGSGKSTLVKHVVIESIKSKFAIPLVIELRELNRTEFSGDLIKYISSEIFHYYKIGNKDNIIEKLLFDGGFLFILDGYDELGSKSVGKATSQIQKMTEKFGSNYYLITSRPYSNIESLKSFTNYTIKGLTTAEQDRLISKLLEGNKYICDSILFEKRKKENSSYLTFLQNPLLLSLFIITFEYHPTLPKKKSLFYEKVFQTLYEKHNSITKVNFKAEFYSKLSEDEFRLVLDLFSFITYFQNLFEFRTDDIRQILTEVKKKYPYLNFDSSSFTKDALETVCIWFNDGNYFSFAHRSLQEYFAVKQIQRLDPKTKGTIYDLLSQFFTENYNLIEIIAEDPDLDYYKKVLIPRVRGIIAAHFEEIDGNGGDTRKLETAYMDFIHLINIDIGLGEIYHEFLKKYSQEKFDNHPLLENSQLKQREILIHILVINKYYSILEKSIEELTTRTIYQNSRIMNFTFNTV